ncbi:hypothetical protein [Actinoplanes sp. NPDC020271]|uniref:hypothetical protein n=1 Tax=Actinoplanes sp. NPDC020271 TaxID=3363896 RepID=UPI0037B7C0D2
MTSALVAAVSIESGDADASVVQRHTTRLRDELLRLDVEEVRRPAVTAPPGARGADLAVIGALLIEAVPLLPRIKEILYVVRTWSRRSGISVTVTIDGDAITVEAASAEQTDRLIDLFVERHSRPDA